MRKKIISVLLIALLLLSSLVFVSCKKGGDAAEDEVAPDAADEMIEDLEEDVEYDESSDFDDPAYENEMDGAEPVMVAHEEKDFYGKWSATSNRSKYLFGNVDLEIKEDGTWSGNIVDEDFSGKWEYKDSSLFIKSDDGLINYNLFFVEDGNMMFKDLDDPDLAPLVLKAQ